MDFKHCVSTNVEGLALLPLARSRFNDLLLWSLDPVGENDGVAIEVESCWRKSYFNLVRTQKSLAFVLPTSKDKLISVCEHWWDHRTAYPLITSAEFHLVSPAFVPPPDIRNTVIQASQLISPSVMRLQRLSSLKGKYLASIAALLLLAFIFILTSGIQRQVTVYPTICGLCSLVGCVVGVFFYTNYLLRRAYFSISKQLENFCARLPASPGFRLSAVGPFALLLELTNLKTDM